MTSTVTATLFCSSCGDTWTTTGTVERTPRPRRRTFRVRYTLDQTRCPACRGAAGRIDYRETK
jgi:hypothetical protein